MPRRPVVTGAAPSAGPVLRLRGIVKRFGAVTANDGIDLDLFPGRILALLGENGAGKTTLMNILFGHYAADEGSVEVAGPDGVLQPLRPGAPEAALAAGIGMVHQHFTLADNLTVLDNVILGTEPLWRPFQRRRPARARLRALMDRAGLQVPLDARIGSLSVGERQRVEILKALYRDARVLILDEPTAVLTPGETERLFETLRHLARDGLSIVFISHKLAEVMALAEEVVVLRAGRTVAAFRTAATSREALAESMVGRPVPPVVRPPLPRGEPLLRIEAVDLPAGPGRTGLHRASLTVHAREVVGIAGVSGNGQKSLSDLLCGLARPSAGRIELFGRPMPLGDPAALVRAGMGRIPEDRHHDGVVGDMTVWENAALETVRERPLARHGLLDRAAGRRHARSLIERYDVRCPGPDAAVRLLSGGNIQKLILGRVLERGPRLILASQPTRGLDIGAVTEVHRRLLEARAAGAGILLISEDLDELLALSDRIAVLYRGHLSAPLAAEAADLRTLGLMMAGHGIEARPAQAGQAMDGQAMEGQAEGAHAP